MKHARNILSLTVSILGIILLVLSIIHRSTGEDSSTLLCVGLLCTNISIWTNASRRRRDKEKKDE